MFVIQRKKNFSGNQWDPPAACRRYPTLEMAKVAFEELPFKFEYRIAEEYSVTRYKAVK